MTSCLLIFFFQAEDGIRDLVRSRGLGDVYKRQAQQIVVANAYVTTAQALLLGYIFRLAAVVHDDDLSLIHI